jgi:hypothetical protein
MLSRISKLLTLTLEDEKKMMLEGDNLYQYKIILNPVTTGRGILVYDKMLYTEHISSRH